MFNSNKQEDASYISVERNATSSSSSIVHESGQSNLDNAMPFGISCSIVCGCVVLILCDISHKLTDLEIHEAKLEHPSLIIVDLFLSGGAQQSNVQHILVVLFLIVEV